MSIHTEKVNTIIGIVLICFKCLFKTADDRHNFIPCHTYPCFGARRLKLKAKPKELIQHESNQLLNYIDYHYNENGCVITYIRPLGASSIHHYVLIIAKNVNNCALLTGE